MIVEMSLPELGENITSGVIVKILVSVGEKIAAGQPVVEIETDKAVVEVPADIAGTITAIFVKEGEEIRVGQKMVAVEAQAGANDADKTGDGAVEKPVPVSEPPPEPATPSRPAAAELPGHAEPPPSHDDVDVPDRDLPQPSRPPEDVAPAAPSVRRFAREIGVDINGVPGTGPGGRISIDDVKGYSKSLHTQREASRKTMPGVEIEALPDFSRWGEVERKPMSMIRQKTAGHLGYAWSAIPHVTHFDRADGTHLEAFRKKHAHKAASAGGKLTVTAILLKVVAGALKTFPEFNASLDMQAKEIILKQYVNVGVAVDTDRGLLVPVVREVDRKNLIELSAELSRLAELARTRKLPLEEMQGGNFTISNLGGIGGTGFTPIIHSPEVAILGVSRSYTAPVYINGEFKPRTMIPLSLSYDHRLIDGAAAARFLRWIAEAIEQPLVLSLGG